MVGDVWDFITTPLIPLSSTEKTLLVSTIIDQSTHLRSSYFFTIGPRVSSVTDSLDRFFALHPDVKTLAILGWDNDWGYSYENVLAEIAKRAGVTIVEIQRSLDVADDWRDEVAKVVRKKPDAIFFCYQASVILKRIAELGFQAKLITTSNITEELALKIVPVALSEGVYYTDWRPNDEFIAKFQAKFSKSPMLNAADAYEAMRSIFKALAVDPENPTRGMGKVKYQGVTGEMNFTESHDGNLAQAQLYRISGGVGKLVQ